MCWEGSGAEELEGLGSRIYSTGYGFERISLTAETEAVDERYL